MAGSPRTRFDGFEVDYAARTRRRKRAWRDRRLRRRIVLMSVALFAAMWLVVFVQLASGNDPALRHALERRKARDAVQLRAELSQMTEWGTRQAGIAAQRLTAAQALQRRLQQAESLDAQLRRRDAGLRRQLAQAAGQLRQAAAAVASSKAAAAASAGSGASSAATAAAAAAASSAAPTPLAQSAPAPAPAAAAPAPPPAPAPAPAPVTTRSS
ncbi:MAG TPA: hypothetical protein VMU39_07020 [Solirubrobacteraceae bacterium]|nr:hypothetical protein [Solirubrobacteraceae bacterium]